MQCEEVLRQMWEYLDQELGREEARAVKLHLTECASCHPVYCCDRAFLALLARQRARCTAPSSLIEWMRYWASARI
jgi:mycothiol system anti-sigma-R factor